MYKWQGAVHLNKMLKHNNSSGKKTEQREEEEPFERKMSVIYPKSGDGEQLKGMLLNGETSSVENEDHCVRKAMEDEVLEKTESGCKMEVIKKPKEERCENEKIKETKNTPLMGTLIQVLNAYS